jgi:hypothetical protein
MDKFVTLIGAVCLAGGVISLILDLPKPIEK